MSWSWLHSSRSLNQDWEWLPMYWYFTRHLGMLTINLFSWHFHHLEFPQIGLHKSLGMTKLYMEIDPFLNMNCKQKYQLEKSDLYSLLTFQCLEKESYFWSYTFSKHSRRSEISTRLQTWSGGQRPPYWLCGFGSGPQRNSNSFSLH